MSATLLSHTGGKTTFLLRPTIEIVKGVHRKVKEEVQREHEHRGLAVSFEEARWRTNAKRASAESEPAYKRILAGR